MSNSKLIDGILLTDNCSKPRNDKISRVTPHYMAWYTDAKTCCESFVPKSRMASANYCIGKDGEIWLNVEEKNRAWTTGSSYNDNKSVTIECANYTDNARYGMLPDATWYSLVRLTADIFKRNGISKAVYTGDDSGNLTKHKWYQNTDCPGPWLDKQFDRLALEINKILSGGTVDIVVPENVPSVFGGRYIVNVNGLNVRDSPSLNGNIVTYYDKGQTVYLDDWYTSNDGYIWGRYTGTTSGKKRYIAVGRATGKIEPDDFMTKL